MTTKPVKFYFAYNSPYAFLAHTRLVSQLAPFNVSIEYKPVYSPRTGGGGPDLDSPRIKYIFEDVARFFKAYGINTKPGPFADTGRACRGFFFAQDKGARQTYHNGVYAARWLEGKDIGSDDTLAAIAENAGLDRAEFLAALDDETYAKMIEQSNTDAETDGVFGFPFFIVDGERFWGNDRIEWLVAKLRND